MRFSEGLWCRPPSRARKGPWPAPLELLHVLTYPPKVFEVGQNKCHSTLPAPVVEHLTFSQGRLLEEDGLGKKWEEPDTEVQSEAAMEGGWQS